MHGSSVVIDIHEQTDTQTDRLIDHNTSHSYQRQSKHVYLSNITTSRCEIGYSLRPSTLDRPKSIALCSLPADPVLLSYFIPAYTLLLPGPVPRHLGTLHPAWQCDRHRTEISSIRFAKCHHFLRVKTKYQQPIWFAAYPRKLQAREPTSCYLLTRPSISRTNGNSICTKIYKTE